MKNSIMRTSLQILIMSHLIGPHALTAESQGRVVPFLASQNEARQESGSSSIAEVGEETRRRWNLIRDIVVSIVSIANLLLVIYFYLTARSDRRRDQLRLVKSFWFQEMFLKPNQGQLRAFFERLEAIVCSLESGLETAASQTHQEVLAVAESAIGDVREAVTDFTHQYMDLVHAFSPPTYSDLVGILTALQDELNEGIDRATSRATCENLRQTIRLSKSSFLGALHTHHTRSILDG